MAVCIAATVAQLLKIGFCIKRIFEVNSCHTF
jgi:ABC-type iron transport system FetAB permease component